MHTHPNRPTPRAHSVKRLTAALTAVLLLLALFAFVGCGRTEKVVDHTTKEVSLPKAKKVVRIEIEHVNEKGAVTRVVQVKDAETADLTAKIRRADGLQIRYSNDDSPSVKPFLRVNFYTKKDSRAVLFYEKKGNFYMEQPYVAVWEVKESLYKHLANYDGYLLKVNN